MHWLLVPFHRAFDYSGRSGRPEFYWFLGIFWLAVPVAVAILIPAMNDFDARRASTGATEWFLIAVPLVMFALLVPTIPLLIRRFHDFDWSGWWLLLMFVPLVWPLAFIASAWPGTPGSNRFGPEPDRPRRR